MKEYLHARVEFNMPVNVGFEIEMVFKFGRIHSSLSV